MHLSTSDVAAIAQTLSQPRFGPYLATTGGDRTRALALYDWNARIAAALFHPLHVYEITLRNGIATAIAAVYGASWHLDPNFIGPCLAVPKPATDPVAIWKRLRRKWFGR